MLPLTRILCGVVVVSSLPWSVAQAQVRQRSIHGASDAQYQAFIQQIEKDGLRPIWVQVGGSANQPLFVATAIDDGAKIPWVATHHQTSEGWQQKFNTWTAKGYRLLCVSGYQRGGELNFAGIFVKDGVDAQARHIQTSAEYQKTFNTLTKQGYRPAHINGYSTNQGYRLASIFVRDGITDWRAAHDQTGAQNQKAFDDLSPKGYVPVVIAAYPTGGGVRFANVFAREGNASEWVARSNLTPEGYQREFNDRIAQGYIPTQIVSYPDVNGLRYAALFQQLRKAAPAVKYPLPTTGTEVPELAVFDEAMQKFMKERHILGGTLAVMKDNQLLLARAYGYRDAQANTLMGPDQPLRIASISKPITLAGLVRLIQQGKLSPDTKVVAFLGLPTRGPNFDKRWLDITVQNLIDHKAGFDRKKFGDPMFMSTKIAEAQKKAGPASANDVIAYMLKQPLDFTPGSEFAYSNFGYCILGRVIEKATGKSYIAHMKDEFFTPMGLKTIDLGHTLPADRDPNEPVYLDPAFSPSVFPPNKGQVPAPDGSFYLEAMDAHGGLIASAPDLVRFFSRYRIDGAPRDKRKGNWGFFGSLPGTWTYVGQRSDGYVIAALFNQRKDSSGLPYDDIANYLNKAADSLK